MTVSMNTVRVSLKLPTTVPALLVRARAIVQAMSGNPWFPSPVPALAKVQAALDALDNAETKAVSLTRGLKSARNEARKKLVDYLTRLKNYVQAVANDNPDFAVSIIEGAAMYVIESSSGRKPPLAIYRGPVSGSVRLVARAIAKESSYEWQRSDDGGKTWVKLPLTMQAETVVKGLTPGKTYDFRFRAVTRRFTTNWCNSVSYVMQ